VKKYKIDLITGARPNFMKVAPLYKALYQSEEFEPRLVHTGQHYDAALWQAFLGDFDLPEPHANLHAVKTSAQIKPPGDPGGDRDQQLILIEKAYGELLQRDPPHAVVVVGDVNSTLAAARAATAVGLPLAHLEAGLRSGDWNMPEEHNRVATDKIAQRLWTPSPDANENLIHEGLGKDRIRLVGNIMIDSYLLVEQKIKQRAKSLQTPESYAVVTLHRPENVDHPESLKSWVKMLCQFANQTADPAGNQPGNQPGNQEDAQRNVQGNVKTELIFPLHPRTKKALQQAGLLKSLTDCQGIHLFDPMNYLEFMAWVGGARFVLTDSGGIQEETTYLNIPCLTLRKKH